MEGRIGSGANNVTHPNHIMKINNIENLPKSLRTLDILNHLESTWYLWHGFPDNPIDRELYEPVIKELEADLKATFLDYLEKNHLSEARDRIFDAPHAELCAFIREYRKVRQGVFTEGFPTLPGTHWEWPPSPGVLVSLNPEYQGGSSSNSPNPSDPSDNFDNC